MAKNQGTYVLATIVTPDDQDTYATHDANTGKGGLHYKKTVQDMLNIDVEKREAGMECRVTADPDSSKNGKYLLLNDLLMWEKEKFGDELLLAPPDDGWGNGSSTTHMLTGVATGDSKEKYIDKILTYFDATAKPPPPAIGSLNIVIPSVWTANAQGQSSLTSVSNVQASTQPTGTLSAKFGNSNTGLVTAFVDTVDEGSLDLTAGNPGDDDGVYGSLTLSGEEIFNDVYQQILASVQSASSLVLNNTPHVYRIDHGLDATEITFFVDDPATPALSSILLEATHLSSPRYVSGVPGMEVGDHLLSSFVVENAVSWFYNLTAIAAIESAYSANLQIAPPAGLNRNNNIPQVSIPTSVKANVYTENASVTIRGYNSRALTGAAIAGDTKSIAGTGTTGPIRIDTISEESICVAAGSGKFPTVGSGANECGGVIDSTADLNTTGNEELQMLNGDIGYPSGDYSGNFPTPGPNYTSVPSGSFNNLRWKAFSLGNIANLNSVTVRINGSDNFAGSPIESGISLYVQVVGSTGWLDANSAYPGVGNPVANGDPALDVASSTTTNRRITFGTQPQSGLVLVRLGLPSGSNKSFKSIT